MTVYHFHASKAAHFRTPLNRHTSFWVALSSAPAQPCQPIAGQFILTNGKTDGPTEVCIKRGHFPVLESTEGYYQW